MTKNEKSKLGMALVKCYFCGKEKGIVMNTTLSVKNAEEIEKMNGHAIDFEPCDECKKFMEQGIMFASVKDGESGKNPYRTGKLCVIKDEAVKQFSSPEMFEQVSKTRFAFIEDSVWEQIGLPKGDMANV